MLYFHPTLGKCLRALERKWCILWSFGILYVHLVNDTTHLVYVVVISCIFSRFLVCCAKKNLATLVSDVKKQHEKN
jgi:hypothetical protein